MRLFRWECRCWTMGRFSISKTILFFLSCFFFFVFFHSNVFAYEKRCNPMHNDNNNNRVFFIQFCIALFINIHQNYNILIHRFWQRKNVVYFLPLSWYIVLSKCRTQACSFRFKNPNFKSQKNFRHFKTGTSFLLFLFHSHEINNELQQSFPPNE